MAKVYRSAMGKQIDVEHLLLKNEHVIAVGNLKVNARGDELGPGGKIIKTRDQLMKEYYALNTPTAIDPLDQIPQQARTKNTAAPVQQQIVADPTPEPIAEEAVFNPDSGLDEGDEGDEGPEVNAEQFANSQEVITAPVVPPMRGSMASSIAKPVTVTQKERLPMKKANGIQRF